MTPDIRAHPFPARGTYRLVLVAAVLAGWALRLVLLHRFPFREDEAIYAFWALHAWHEDPFFYQVWPDKPPLFLWLLAAAFRLFGATDVAARWLNSAASILLIPVTAQLARRLWTERAALVAAPLVAFNPYAISYAPTAYTDPLMVLCGMLAVTAGAGGTPLWSGFWLAAAAMAKQQGVFFVPLVVAVVAVTPSRPHKWLYLGGGAALVLAPMLFWDSLRWSVAPSPWDLGRQTYTRLFVLPPAAWPDRIVAWRPWLAYLAGHWTVWAGLVLAGVLAALLRLRTLAMRSGAGRTATRPPAFGWVLTLWAAGYVLLHVGTSMQIWDRYLLPLAPMVALYAGWVAAALEDVRLRVLIAILLVALALPPALTAASGGFPIGGDHGAYRGLRQVVAWLQDQTARPVVVYHRELGWHFQYYLYDAVRAGLVDLRWFPNAVYLADNAAKTPFPPTYYVQPLWAAPADLPLHLSIRGLAMDEQFRSGNFIVWKLDQPASPLCTACWSAVPSPSPTPWLVPNSWTPPQEKGLLMCR